MFSLTESDLFDLNNRLSKIRAIQESNNIRNTFSHLRNFMRIAPERLSLYYDKMFKSTDRLKPVATMGVRVIRQKFYIKQCKHYIENFTYLTEQQIDNLIKDTVKILNNHCPKDEKMDEEKLMPYAWCFTTVTLMDFQSKNPNVKTLSYKEIVALINNKCRTFQTNVQNSSKTQKAKYLFFIIGLIFSFNIIYHLIYGKHLKTSIAILVAINLTVILVYYYILFLVQSKKKLQENKQLNESDIGILNKVKSFASSSFSRISNFDQFFSKQNYIFKKLEPVVKKIKDPKKIYIVFVNLVIKRSEQDEISEEEVTSLSKKIFKYILATFDIGMKSTLLLPLSWICILTIIIEYKNMHPHKKITKEIILQSAKEYFYKQSLRLAKFKAKTKEQKTQTYALIAYLYFTLLVFKVTPFFAIVAAEYQRRSGTNPLRQLSIFYLMITTTYLLLSLKESIKAAEEGFK